MKISPFTNVGITWKGQDGHIYKLRRRGNPRLTIRLSTYMVMSAIGAMHYYCRIKGETLEIHDTTENKWLCLGGYGPNKPNEANSSCFEFDAKRVLHKVEKDLSGDIVGSIGESTGRFNEPEEALRAGIALAVETFRDTPSKHWCIEFGGLSVLRRDVPLRILEFFDEAEFRLHELDADKILKKVLTSS